MHLGTNNGLARLTVAISGNIGIGHINPLTLLHVNSVSSFMNNVDINTTSATAGLDIHSTFICRNSNPVTGAELTSIDANGSAGWVRPNDFKTRDSIDGQPNFIENLTWTKVFFNQSLPYNIGLSYEPINAQMVAPVSGVYHFDAQIHWDEKYFESGIRLVLNRNEYISLIAENFDSLCNVQTGDILIFKKPNQLSTEILCEFGGKV